MWIWIGHLRNRKGSSIKLTNLKKHCSTTRQSRFLSHARRVQRIGHVTNSIPLNGLRLGSSKGRELPSQSYPNPESSRNYCNANHPVITLSARQAPERAASILINVTMWLTHVPSCYRASFELSPAGICWLRYHPPAIVPRLISSLFQFEFFTEVKWEDLQVWSAHSQKKRQLLIYGNESCS